MKKIFALIISAFMLFSLVSCAEEKTPSSSDAQTSSSSSNEQASSEVNVLASANEKAKEVIDEQTDDTMTDIEKARKTYEWLYNNFKYRAVEVDVSGGYVDELTAELCDYYFKYHRGSCEHYAAAQKVLLDNLGFETFILRARDMIREQEYGASTSG